MTRPDDEYPRGGDEGSSDSGQQAREGGGGGGDGGGSRKRRGGRGGRSGRGKRRKDENGPVDAVAPVPEGVRAAIESSLAGGEFIVFDIESTGGNPERNGITEIFAVRYRNGEALDTFGSLVNPGIPIPPIVRRMTGIDNKMVRNAPRIDAVMPDFIKFIGDAVLVSHNTIGDMKFIRYFAKETTGHDVQNFFLCTHLLVERLAHEAPDKSLKGLADYFDLPRGALHRAEADSWLTLELFKVLLGKLRGRGVERILEAVRLQGDLESAMRLGWGVPRQDVDDVPGGPGVFYLHDHDGKVLFLSSATHLDREVAKLKGHGQLPRQLLRLVLRSYGLKAQRSANSFAAMLDEGRALTEHNVTFNPLGWHQRCVQALFLVEEPARAPAPTDGASPPAPTPTGTVLRLDVGPLEPGTTHAWGPVRDRRIAGEFLGRLAAAMGLKAGRRGLILSHEDAAIVRSFLDGTLGPELEGLKRRGRSMALWFKPSERKGLKARIAVRERLMQSQLPGKIGPMLDRMGVLVVPDKSSHERDRERRPEASTDEGRERPESRGDRGWQLHVVVGSRPVAMTPFKGDLDAKLRQGLAKELAEAVRAEAAKLGAAATPLSAEDVYRVNAALWWIVNGRGDGRWLSASDLER
jgi:DNA polymerase III epsilon subunit family exonuclease